MADVQEVPVTRADVAARRDKDDLIDQLDSLLERYLCTLHEYQQVMQELSKQLSSGYISLAQANYHNSSSAIRYGKDCYDERMQAIRKVHVSETGCPKRHRPHFSVQSDEVARQGVHVSDAEVKEYQREVEGKGSMFYHTEVPSEPEAQAKAGQDANDESTQEQKEPGKPAKADEKSADPLRWFGILVPPALRSAQSTFVGAVEGPIPQLATIARDLRTQEMEIGRVKKMIYKL
ncbi:hypothetical protein BDW02DRAFT_564880 [Decorospora gaudefroyi]|uniref:Vacuolar ATPase assembly protein VMA22 n=1 Tax=Decorospora gaudefroyi TaxID=184978 RepID=A0A6A5KMZ2_9PLEO|nr:hypothetical protein BDW02DRAFT_564880 [Decorospora gaudefroyi]